MKDWIIEETKSIDFNDKRLDSRFRKILDNLSDNPVSSLPQSLRGHSELIAAYRFMNNEKVNYEEIMQSHQKATLQRIEESDVILAVQDTTSIDFTKKKISEHLGHLESSKRRGYFLHPTLLFDESGTCLGTYKSKIWTRNIEDLGKRTKRKELPFEEKESYRWFESYQHACEIAEDYPDKTVISVGDRESDIYELFYEGCLPGSKADLVFRAGQNRRTTTEENDVKLLRDRLDDLPIEGVIEVTIPRTPTRKKRFTKIEIKYSTIELLVPPSKKKELSNIKLNVVNFKEVGNSDDEEAIEWVLMTTLSVSTMEEAIRILQIYKARWQIEVFFRTLKSGCKIEELYLQNPDRMLPLIAMYLIVTWRIMYLMKLSRCHPEIPAEIVFEEDEWKVAFQMSTGKKPTSQPTLREIIRMIASFGGFLGRKSDGEPGPEQIWIGLRRLADFTLAYRFLKGS